MPPIEGFQTSAPPPAVGGQALLKRRPGMTSEAFKAYYIEHHARLAMPWCLDNGVVSYVQYHRPLRWTSPEVEQKFSALGINLEDFDAVGEMLFPPVVTIDDFYRPKVGKTYHVQVLLPDERRFLLDEALNHLQGVPSGSVTGEIVEFIVDGAPVVDLGNWSNYYHAIKRGSCIVRDEDRTLSLRSSPAHEHTQAERKIEQKSTFE